MQYMILYKEKPQELQDIVGEYIADGWEPLGGVAATCYTSENRDGFLDANYEYVQALIKRDATCP